MSKNNIILKRSGNWKKLLKEIYNNTPNNIGDTDIRIKRKLRHYIAIKYGLTDAEFSDALAFLDHNKLIRIIQFYKKSEKVSQFILTEKGFNVALDIEKNHSFERQNIILSVFTAILAMASAINIFGLTRNLFFFILVFFILAGVYFYFRNYFS